MTFQPTCISADTAKCLHDSLLAMRRPPWLRAMSAFTRPVDTTAPALEITPPPYYTAVNPCHSRQERARGREDLCPHSGALHSGSDSHSNEHARTFPARHTVLTRTDSSLASPRACASALTPESPQGAFRVALPLSIRGRPEPTSVVPGKILSPIRVFRGRITVGARPRLPWFLRRTRRLLPRCEKDIPISKE